MISWKFYGTCFWYYHLVPFSIDYKKNQTNQENSKNKQSYKCVRNQRTTQLQCSCLAGFNVNWLFFRVFFSIWFSLILYAYYSIGEGILNFSILWAKRTEDVQHFFFIFIQFCFSEYMPILKSKSNHFRKYIYESRFCPRFLFSANDWNPSFK